MYTIVWSRLARGVSALILTCTALSACSGGSGSRVDATSPPSTTASSIVSPASSALTSTPTSSPSAVRPVAPVGTPSDVVTNLAAPWSIAFAGSTALLTERDSAQILELVGASTRVVGTISEVRRDSGEGGLLGLAIHDRDLFVYYTAAHDNRITRYALTGQPGSLGLGGSQTILTGIPSNTFHNGGRIKFGPDGMLYISTGDSGNRSTAQDLKSLGGKILRIATTGAIPADNPFPGSPVWSLGHRNVQGLGWAADGTMFASEFGANTHDELNVIRPGRNYGWPAVEGIAHDPRFTDPVQQWPPAQASPSGLAVVNATIFIANLRGQVLRAIPTANPAAATEYFLGTYGRLRDVELAPDGSLWLMTNNSDGRGTPRDGDDRILRVRLE